MKAPVWNKGGIEIDERIMRFMAGHDALLDRVLLPYDIEATRAHVLGLGEIGALSGEAVEGILGALESLAADFASGAFVLDERFEDGHSAIEHYLVEKLGEDGGRVHLGRSRNDQVLVALRLYMKDVVGSAAERSLACAEAALARAEQHEMDPMPGYTHLQRAVPSSIGLWMGSFAEGFASDAMLLIRTREWLDACPLGTAAGYGVNVDLPRDKASERLGFARTLINPMFAQATRGTVEAQVLGALWQSAQTIRRLAWDMVLFSTAEFGFVTLPNAATTGSSIMPNKRNPDLAELLRGVAPVVSGCIAELHAHMGLPSGYHRDLQHTKGPLIRGATITLDALELVPRLISGTELHLERMRGAIDKTMFATDDAVAHALAGDSFRDAYRKVADSIGEVGDRDPSESLRARVSLGGTANLGLDRIGAWLVELRSELRG